MTSMYTLQYSEQSDTNAAIVQQIYNNSCSRVADQIQHNRFVLILKNSRGSDYQIRMLGACAA